MGDNDPRDLKNRSVIQTIKQNCRRCYTCVRGCPAKAIRILDGQASVVKERCISCGHCVIRCSQNAKAYESGVENSLRLMNSKHPTALLVAPSWPAEFSEMEREHFFGAAHEAGFTYVIEVAAGADLIAHQYKNFLEKNEAGPWIASTCPAVVDYVQKYHPSLVKCLVPIISPMIATGLLVSKLYGPEVKCIFAGPCIGKKKEAHLEGRALAGPEVNAIAEVLTFVELRKIFELKNIELNNSVPQGPDYPHASLGRAFPLIGGILYSANIPDDLLDSRIISAGGLKETPTILEDLELGKIKPWFVELLMCRGCYDGPGMSKHTQRYSGKTAVTSYIKTCDASKEVQKILFPDKRNLSPDDLKTLQIDNTKRVFYADNQRPPELSEDEIRRILVKINKFTKDDELNCGACGYKTCREKAIAVGRGLAEEAMCLPFMLEQAERVCNELKIPWRDMREIHRHIINTEKLASMGQLAAGIAHELNNPLGTIMLFSSLLKRKLAGRADVERDLHLISEESQRCKKIISGLLDFARQGRLEFKRIDLGSFMDIVLDRTFPLNYLKDKNINVAIDIPQETFIDVDYDQMLEVFINIIRNAAESMEPKKELGTIRIDTGTIDIFTKTTTSGTIQIIIRDQGQGIKKENQDKVFQPFFTTKHIGKGTGLGLPIAYGIVKNHRGKIWFESKEKIGTTFYIELPRVQSHTTWETHL